MKMYPILAVAVAPILAFGAAVTSEQVLGPDAIAQQMRWPFSMPERSGARKASAYPIEELITGMPTDTAKSEAVKRLKSAVANASSEPIDEVTTTGFSSESVAAATLRSRDLCFEYALLYRLTAEPDWAKRSTAILLRFAEAVPQWSIFQDSKQRSQTDLTYLKDPQARGLWGKWFYFDLEESLPLLRAYDIVRPTLSEEEKARVEQLFRHQKEFTDKCDISRSTNLMGYHLGPLILYGKVLGEPRYIDDVLHFWNRLLQESYFADGFWRETTPNYHLQISNRTMKEIPALLKGYSAPEGYLPPAGKPNLKNLDLEQAMRHRFANMNQGLEVLALPDGTYLSINDAWPKSKRTEAPEAADSPALLGAAGIARLGARKMSAFLKFTGIRGHDHMDALNLVWFAGGREVFGETGYRPTPGSTSTREWNSATASHNTVAIDEISHYTNREGLTVNEPFPRTAFLSRPPQKTEGSHAKVVAHLPTAARFTNQGKLLFWDGSAGEVQAMEAEAPNAYPGLASLFRRTIVFVPLAEGEGYLVDIFRVKGGSKHDFFLRGGLDDPYTMTFDLPLTEREGTVYSYIRLSSGAEIEKDRLVATTRYPNGLQVRSLLAGSGNGAAKLELLCGEAPAIRRNGEAPFSIIRRSTENPEETLESCFVWVHEAFTGKQRIQDVKLHPSGMNLCIELKIDGRTDYLFSGVSDDSLIAAANWKFQGRLAYASSREGTARGRVFAGGALTRNEEIIAKANHPFSGKVNATTRVEAGDNVDSAIVELRDHGITDDDLKRLNLAHFDLGDVIRISIPIREVRQEGDKTCVVLKHTPGFVIRQDRIEMTQFPGWRISGDVTVELSHSQRGK